MKKILVILCCLAFTITSMSCITTKIPAKFDVAVSFGSMASGPSSDDFLKSFIAKFAKKNRVKISGYKAAGCGREGEFKILFSIPGIKTETKKKFIAELNKVVTAQEKKNKAEYEHSGNITVEYNKTKADVSYCRQGIAIWK